MRKLRHIQSKIGTETAYRIPVSVEDAIAEALAAYDALTAKLDRMSRVLKDCAPNLQNKDELYGLKWAVCDILSQTPAASLLLHDAEVLNFAARDLEFIEKTDKEFYEPLSDGWRKCCTELRSTANKLRLQADALEGEG
jgi:hypothetical protein